jgi:CHAT domain-containing protein/tetratricopeptide (TPR) repeat protein
MKNIKTVDEFLTEIISFLEIKNYDKAIKTALELLSYQLKIYDKNNIEIFNTYIILGNCYRDTNDFEKALYYYHLVEAIPVEHHKINKLELNNNIAAIYHVLRKYEEAIQYYKNAITACILIFDDESMKLISMYTNIATIYLILNQYEFAKNYSFKALDIFHKNNIDEDVNLIHLYNTISTYYEKITDIDKALLFCDKALLLSKKAYTLNHSISLTIYTNKGSLLTSLGKLDKAYTVLLETLKRKRKLNMEFELSHTYHNLGVYCEKIADYKQSLNYFNLSLEIKQKYLNSEDLSIGNTFYNIANTLRYLGDYEGSLILLKKALDIRKIVLGENNLDVAIIYLIIGVEYMKINEYSTSIQYMNKALNIQENIFPEDSIKKTEIYLGISALFIEMQEYDKALYFSLKVSYIHKNKLSIYNYDTSVVYDTLGLIYENKKDYAQAYIYFLKAAKLKSTLQKTISSILNYSQKINYIKKNNTSYSIFKLIKNSKKYQEELEQDEKIIIIQETCNIWLNHKGSIQDNEALLSIISKYSKDINLQEKIDTLKSKKYSLAKLLQEQTSKDIKDLIDSTQKKISNIEKYLSQHIEKFKSERELDTISLKDISNYLQKDEVFIDFAAGKDNIYIFILDKSNNIEFIQISTENTILIHDQVLNFRDNIDKTIKAIKEMIKELKGKKLSEQKLIYSKLEQDVLSSELKIKDTLKILYSILIEKYLSKYIKANTKLLISPDGILNLLSFEALYDGEAYLLNKVDITYISSGREFVRVNKFNNLSNKEKGISVFANPNYNDTSNGSIQIDEDDDETNSFRTTRALDKFVKCKPLWNTQKEAEAIKEVFTQTDLFTEAKASETNIQAISDSSILHIATHGIVVENEDEQEPLLKCALALSGYNTSVEQKKDYGIFTGLKIASLDLANTDLVVLSACESAKGSSDDIVGVSSLSRAFMMAGANATIASLWEANDDMAKDFFTLYYSNLNKNQTYAQAFKTTQKELYTKYKAQNLEHPLFWSCFCFFGAK